MTDSVSERCHVCDRPKATPEQWRSGACGLLVDDDLDGCECDACCALCWGDTVGCASVAVDWRARALAAEAELAAIRAAL